jgi:hypothetical protein
VIRRTRAPADFGKRDLGPTGVLSSTARYLSVFLTGRQIDIPDAGAVALIRTLEPSLIEEAIECQDAAENHKYVSFM